MDLFRLLIEVVSMYKLQVAILLAKTVLKKKSKTQKKMLSSPSLSPHSLLVEVNYQEMN